MKDNIMFYPAIVLMVVEALALVFLICAWRKAKRNCRQEPPRTEEIEFDYAAEDD